MNIFILDNNPKIAAHYHCDKHVVKMIVESAQLLSSVYYNNINNKWYNRLTSDDLTDYYKDDFIKPTHMKHPCTIWVNEDLNNWKWLLDLFKHLLNEYTIRYNKTHKMERLYSWFIQHEPKWLKNDNLTEFKLAMKNIYKRDTPVESYREYYIQEKSRFAKWKLGNIPDWYKNNLPTT